MSLSYLPDRNINIAFLRKNAFNKFYPDVKSRAKGYWRSTDGS